MPRRANALQLLKSWLLVHAQASGKNRRRIPSPFLLGQHLQSDAECVQAHLAFSLSAWLAVLCSMASGEDSVFLPLPHIK